MGQRRRDSRNKSKDSVQQDLGRGGALRQRTGLSRIREEEEGLHH